MKHQIDIVEPDHRFHCRDEQNLLEGMRSFQLGMPMLQAIPVGCRGGGCGICRIRVLGGEYETTKMSRKHVCEEDQARGFALACRVYPRSNLVIEVLSLPEQEQKSDTEDEPSCEKV